MADKKKFDTGIDEETLEEYTIANFDKSIVDLGISLVEDAIKTSNHEHKFKLVDAIVKLRGVLPPVYFKRK